MGIYLYLYLFLLRGHEMKELSSLRPTWQPRQGKSWDGGFGNGFGGGKSWGGGGGGKGWGGASYSSPGGVWNQFLSWRVNR